MFDCADKKKFVTASALLFFFFSAFQRVASEIVLFFFFFQLALTAFTRLPSKTMSLAVIGNRGRQAHEFNFNVLHP